MSNLLEQASLVMIPSGYKEDVVYSEIPLDGSGDMTLTRASNGTRVNSAGLVEVCPWNLVQQSENYSVSPWNRSYITVTPNDIVAPNGTTTGNKIVLNNSGSQRYQLQQGVTTNTTLPMTFTFYAKKNQIDTFIGVIGGASGMSYEVQFNLTNGTATEVYNSSGINTAKSIENVGNGWYKCTITAGSSSGLITGVNIFKDTTGNGTDSFYIWGTQFNFGSTAKPYFPTTDRLNVPRLTYQNGGGGCPSLLLEKQSTNLLVYSEQFDQWATSGTTTSNVAISPDGTQNADRLNYTSGNLYWLDAGVNVINGVAYTFTLYVKPTSVGNQFRFYIDGGFNASQTITTDSSDWKRYEWTFTATATTSINPHILLGYGMTSQSILVWGAQLEASSYATSYIPTTSSSATRVADACYKTGISSLIGQTEGVIFADFVYLGETQSEVIDISDGTENNRVMIYITSVGTFQVYVTTSATTDGFIVTSYSPIVGSRYKVAVAYKSNDIAFYVNGSLLGTDTSATIPTTSKLTISNGGAGNYLLASQFNQAVLFKTRLTNAELASLTTI